MNRTQAANQIQVWLDSLTNDSFWLLFRTTKRTVAVEELDRAHDDSQKDLDRGLKNDSLSKKLN